MLTYSFILKIEKKFESLEELLKFCNVHIIDLVRFFLINCMLFNGLLSMLLSYAQWIAYLYD